MDARQFRMLSFWVLLIGSGVLISVILAEGLLRIAGISYPVFDTYDEIRGMALRAGTEGWYEKEGKAYLRINSLGYRDDEHDFAKPVATYRIAILGDSFTEARQVPQEVTFWSLLGSGLGVCPGLNGRKVEVLNFGIGSYGTAQELLTLRKDALRFSPDLVLLAFFPDNDLQDNSKELSQAEPWRMPRPYFVRSNGALVLDETFRASYWRRFLYESVHYSRVLQLVNEVRRIRYVQREAESARKTQGNPEPGTSAAIYAPPSDAAWQEAWLITEDLLDRINREVTATGARFAVTTISTPRQVEPDVRLTRKFEERLGVQDLFYPDRRIREVGKTHGFLVIDLAERLQKIAMENGVYLHGFGNSVLGEGHWNEAGHRYASTILIEEICTKVITQPTIEEPRVHS